MTQPFQLMSDVAHFLLEAPLEHISDSLSFPKVLVILVGGLRWCGCGDQEVHRL